MDETPKTRTKRKSYNSLLRKAFYAVGGFNEMSRICGVRVSAVYRWYERGHLPRTEWTGETHYAELIEAATNGAVTKEELLTHKPIRAKRARPTSLDPLPSQ